MVAGGVVQSAVGLYEVQMKMKVRDVHRDDSQSLSYTKTVLNSVELPTGVTNLNTGLTNVDLLLTITTKRCAASARQSMFIEW